MKGQNTQRKLRYFHLPTHQGPAAGSPAPPASLGESSSLAAFQTDFCWASVQAVVWPWPLGPAQASREYPQVPMDRVSQLSCLKGSVSK